MLSGCPKTNGGGSGRPQSDDVRRRVKTGTNHASAAAARRAFSLQRMLVLMVEDIRSDETAYVKLFGFSVTYERITKLAAGLIGALASGLFKLALS